MRKSMMNVAILATSLYTATALGQDAVPAVDTGNAGFGSLVAAALPATAAPIGVSSTPAAVPETVVSEREARQLSDLTEKVSAQLEAKMQERFAQ